MVLRVLSVGYGPVVSALCFQVGGPFAFSQEFAPCTGPGMAKLWWAPHCIQPTVLPGTDPNRYGRLHTMSATGYEIRNSAAGCVVLYPQIRDTITGYNYGTASCCIPTRMRPDIVALGYNPHLCANMVLRRAPSHSLYGTALGNNTHMWYGYMVIRVYGSALGYNTGICARLPYGHMVLR